MDEYDRADKKANRLLDNLKADGFREAGLLRWEYNRNNIEDRPRVAGIITQIDKFLRSVPRMYAPKTYVNGSTADSDSGLAVSLDWSNHALDRIVPRARFEVTFMSECRVRYHGMIYADKNVKHEVRLTEGRLLDQAITEAKKFFKKWPESPKVDVVIDANTPLGRILSERNAVITNLESLDRAVADAYYATDRMKPNVPRISKTGVPELDEFAADFKKEYEKMAKRLSKKYRQAVLVELFPLARQLYRMRLDLKPHTRRPHHIFQDCAEAVDADVCWKCCSLGGTTKFDNKEYRRLCQTCLNSMISDHLAVTASV